MEHIMSYRYCMIMADGGELDFGPSMHCPADMEDFPDDVHSYSVQTVENAVS